MTKKLKIEINLDNAAFDDEFQDIAVANVLIKIADRIHNYGRYDSFIRDINGNTIGKLILEEEE